jgi:hypothetical protein
MHIKPKIIIYQKKIFNLSLPVYPTQSADILGHLGAVLRGLRLNIH